MTTGRLVRRHPDAQRIDAYADGRLDWSDRAAIAEHLTGCEACRGEVAALCELGERARAVAVPPLPAGALDRVLARRAAGERYILASGEPRPPREQRAPLVGRMVVRWIVAGASIAAAAVALVMAGVPGRIASTFAVAGSARGIPGSETVLATAPVVLLEPARLKPAVLRYRTTAVTDSVFAAEVAESELDIARARLNERDAWYVRSRVVSSFVPAQQAMRADELFLDGARLAPLRQVFVYMRDHNGATVLAPLVAIMPARRVVADSGAADLSPVRAAADAWLSRPRTSRASARAFALEFDLGRRVGPSSLEVGVQTLPLRRGWSGRVPLTPAGLPTWLEPILTPPRGVEGTTLRVLGEERVRVPAGTFDCWKVEVSGGPRYYVRQTYASHTLWVAKDGGWVVKRVETVVHTPGRGTTDYVRELTSLSAGR